MDEFLSEQKIECTNTDLVINTSSVRTLCLKTDIRISFVKKQPRRDRGGGGLVTNYRGPIMLHLFLSFWVSFVDCIY